MIKPKKKGASLEIKVFEDNNGNTYLVFKTQKGSYHVFTEVEAKEAARKCGATKKGDTRQMWDELWNKK
jgi:hypothetical protein